MITAMHSNLSWIQMHLKRELGQEESECTCGLLSVVYTKTSSNQELLDGQTPASHKNKMKGLFRAPKRQHPHISAAGLAACYFKLSNLTRAGMESHVKSISTGHEESQP